MRAAAVVMAAILFAPGPRVEADDTKIIPQAQPVHAWLKAVKEADKDALKKVFSERMREQFDKLGWDTVLAKYREVFAKEFGADYKPEDFTFAYEGNENSGKVVGTQKGKKHGGLRVIKEKDGWKVDER